MGALAQGKRALEEAESTDGAAPTHEPKGISNAWAMESLSCAAQGNGAGSSFLDAAEAGVGVSEPWFPSATCDEAAAKAPAADKARAPVYDLGQLDDVDAVVADLKGGDAQKARLAATIANTKRSYQEIIDQGGRVVVTTSEGNGGEPVVTIVPPGYDPEKASEVHTHYHGYSGTVGDGPTEKSKRFQNIMESLQNDPQTVFVLPESEDIVPEDRTLQPGEAFLGKKEGGGTSRRFKTRKIGWGNAENQEDTTADALAAAGITPTEDSTYTVSAHSAGGQALRNVIANNPDAANKGVRADRLELYDCLYGKNAEYISKLSDNADLDTVNYYRGTNSRTKQKTLERGFADFEAGGGSYASHGGYSHNGALAENFPTPAR